MTGFASSSVSLISQGLFSTACNNKYSNNKDQNHFCMNIRRRVYTLRLPCCRIYFASLAFLGLEKQPRIGVYYRGVHDNPLFKTSERNTGDVHVLLCVEICA